MKKPEPYHITAAELADLWHISEGTAIRRMKEVRRALGLPPGVLLRRYDVLSYFHLL